MDPVGGGDADGLAHGLADRTGDIADCGARVREDKDERGWFDLSTLREPYRLEGKKTMGYELAEQLLARVIRVVPNHRSAHYARAQALIHLGREEEAQHELQVHMNVLVASGEGF